MKSINPQDLAAFAVLAVINIIVVVLFCKSLIKALSYVSLENQVLKSNTVWWLLVPGINYLMNFLVVSWFSKSITNELESRDFLVPKRPAFLSGLTFAVLSLLAAATLFIPIPEKFAVVAGIIGFAQIFFFIQYWMKINWYKTILEQDGEEYDEEEEDGENS